MPASKIMLIRHSEKPSGDGTIKGISNSGDPNPEGLTVRGWQRAGALARFFSPLDQRFIEPGIATPDTIFASGVGAHSKSERPRQTVEPLAELLGKTTVEDYLKGDEIALATACVAKAGVVLVAWEHVLIHVIANAIVGNAEMVPQNWPDDRFDVVWVLDRQLAGWSFSQVPQLLLGGDKEDLIA